MLPPACRIATVTPIAAANASAQRAAGVGCVRKDAVEPARREETDMDHRTVEARLRLRYFLWTGVALAVLGGLISALALRDDSGGGHAAAVALAVLTLTAAAVFTAIAVIGWGVYLGMRAAGFVRGPAEDGAHR